MPMQSLWLPFIPCYIHGIFDSVSNFLFPHCRLFAMRYFEPPIDWLLVINCNSYLLLCLCMSAVAWISVQYGVALDRDERTQSMWSLNPACVSESYEHHLLSIKNMLILIIVSFLLWTSMHVLRKIKTIRFLCSIYCVWKF